MAIDQSIARRLRAETARAVKAVERHLAQQSIPMQIIICSNMRKQSNIILKENKYVI